MLIPLSLTPSFGFGDRLGLATPGHLSALRAAGAGIAPVFAQQSVRENTRTGRTPLQVLMDAKNALDKAGWDAPWGADADHLKTLDDLSPFLDAGYTFFTVDPGAYVDSRADQADLPSLRQHYAEFNPQIVKPGTPEELLERYRQVLIPACCGQVSDQALLRAAVKYGRVIDFTALMYQRIAERKEAFDFEVSVDETESPTTPLEHFFIAHELTRAGVRFTSLAPRFSGRFEKGVDYIGDLSALERELACHGAIRAQFGTYKLSLHSGSDKFSVYPLIARHWRARFHIKTAGTSYLEALRVLAEHEPALFGKIFELGRMRYATDRVSYHVSAEAERIASGLPLPALLDDFHAREILHVTFGSALARYGAEIRSALRRHEDAYLEGLRQHFERHLRLLTL